MLYFESNMEIVKTRFPHISGQKSNNFGSDLEFTVERDIQWLSAIDGIINNEESQSVFVYGFGNGFSLADLLDVFPDKYLFVYEPDEQLFYQSLDEYNLSLLLNHPHFYWLCVGEEQLKMLFYIICTYMQDDINFIALRQYLESDVEVLYKVNKDFQEFRNTFLLSTNIKNRFRLDWTKNYLYNLADILITPSIEQIVNVLKGSTAIVVSSGPSLEEDIKWIKKLYDNTLIIAAGSSVQALVKNEIYPHLAVIMDGHPLNNKIFSSTESVESPLLFTASSYYEISDQKSKGRIHSIMKGDTLAKYLMGIHDEENLYISSTETVAGTAIQAAVALGASRVILTGQDLSFPNLKFYADGIEHFGSEELKGAINQAEHKVLNVNGTYNVTDERFLIMKYGIENLIATYPDVEFINSSRYGARIEGAPFSVIEELYEVLKNGNSVPNTLQNSLHEHEKTAVSLDRTEYVKAKLEYINSDINMMRDEIVALKKKMIKIREYSRTKPLKGQRVIEEIEQAWGAIANREWFSPLLETIIPMEVATFDKQLPNIVTEHSLTIKSDLIYEHLGTLLDAIMNHIPLIQEMLDESLLRVNGVRQS